MRKRFLLASVILCILLSSCSLGKEPATIALPEGRVAKDLGDHLLQTAVGPYIVEEYSIDETAEWQSYGYCISSLLDDSVGYIYLTGRDDALEQVQLSISLNWDDPENSLITTQDGILMYKILTLGLLEDMGLDKQALLQAEQEILNADWRADLNWNEDGGGMIELYVGGLTLRRLTSDLSEHVTGGLTLYILPGDRTGE